MKGFSLVEMTIALAIVLVLVLSFRKDEPAK